MNKHPKKQNFSSFLRANTYPLARRESSKASRATSASAYFCDIF